MNNITKHLTKSQIHKRISQLEVINDLIDGQMRDFGDYTNYEFWKANEQEIGGCYEALISLKEQI